MFQNSLTVPYAASAQPHDAVPGGHTHMFDESVKRDVGFGMGGVVNRAVWLAQVACGFVRSGRQADASVQHGWQLLLWVFVSVQILFRHPSVLLFRAPLCGSPCLIQRHCMTRLDSQEMPNVMDHMYGANHQSPAGCTPSCGFSHPGVPVPVKFSQPPNVRWTGVLENAPHNVALAWRPRLPRKQTRTYGRQRAVGHRRISCPATQGMETNGPLNICGSAGIRPCRRRHQLVRITIGMNTSRDYLCDGLFDEGQEIR
jgi:hypothetical protein